MRTARIATAFVLLFLAVKSGSAAAAASPRRFQPKVNLQRVFRNADLNRDGWLSFHECYERLLVFYVHLNRQAEIDPPSPNRIRSIYETLGWNWEQKKLNYDEFVVLTQILMARTTTRFIVYRIVELLCAPILALSLVNILSRYTGSVRVPTFLPFHNHMGAKVFWISVVTAITTKQLPRLFVMIVNRWIDKSHPFARRFHPETKQR